MARSHGGILTVIPLVSALIGAGAQAQMGPAMNSFLMNVKTDHEQCGAATFAANRPAAWRHAVTAPTIERAGQGVFMITAPGAAPLPGTSPRAGFFVDVTAVGSNAHCFEDSDYVRGSDFQSQVRCVRPDGSPVDSEFAWSYRSDSLDLVQYSVYRANFGYAQIGTDGALASFFTPAAHALVTSKRLGKGRFKVVFGKLGTASADMVPGVDASVQICRTPACASDTCSVAAWSIGATSSTVDVRCFTKKGEPVDASFRVFIGQEALNSQEFGVPTPGRRVGDGVNFGWVDSSERRPATGPGPIANPHIVYMARSKEAVGKRKVVYFHTAPGKYAVAFEDQIVYGPTCWDLHVTARELDSGTYCNIGATDHAKGLVGVACFDGEGLPRDARWSLTMRRQYNN